MTKVKNRTYRYSCHNSCGKSFASKRGLSLHKSQKSHWVDPEQVKQTLQETRFNKKTYIGEFEHRLVGGQSLTVGEKIKIVRVGVVKEVLYADGEDFAIIKIDATDSSYTTDFL